MIGSGSYSFSSGRSAKKHDHEWVPVSEQSVIDTRYNNKEVSYLKDVDSMLEGLQGLLERNTQARSIRIEALERIAELEGMIPSEPVKAHRYKAGVIYGQACAFELAAKELEKAVKLAPESMDDRNQMAIYYFLGDNWERAKQVWEDILQSDPEYEGAVKQYTAALAQKFNKSKNAEERIAYSEKLVELHPESQRYHRDLGVCCQDAGRWEEAISNLEFTITHATDPLGSASVEDFKAEIKDRIAFCHSKLGRYAEAVRYWEEALAEKNWSSSERNAILTDLRKAQAQLQTSTKDDISQKRDLELSTCEDCMRQFPSEQLAIVKTRHVRAPQGFFSSTEKMCQTCIRKWQNNPGCRMRETSPGNWVREWIDL
jgi:tetratricopeptide (TPR) repeat protein